MQFVLVGYVSATNISVSNCLILCLYSVVSIKVIKYVLQLAYSSTISITLSFSYGKDHYVFNRNDTNGEQINRPRA